MFVPGVQTVFACAPAALVGCWGVGTAKIKSKVFLARQVSAPGCFAAGAVVQGAQHGAPLRVGGRAHQGMASGRAAHAEGRAHRQPAGEARGAHHLPLLVFQLDLKDRQAMRVLRFAHLFGVHGVEAAHMQQTVVGVFVVDGDQPTARSGEREIDQAIVVHAHLHGLLVGGVGAVHFECGHVARDAHWLAPRGQRRGHIAFGHHQPVAHAHRNAFEADFGLSGSPARTARQWGQRRGQRQGHATFEKTAAGLGQHIMDAGVGRAVAVFHAAEIFGHDGFTSGVEMGGD